MKILIFDFDSTLILDEGLDLLFERSLEAETDPGTREARVEAFGRITDLGMAGELPFNEALDRRMRLLRADRELVSRVGAELAGRLTPSVERHISFFGKKAPGVHILSGGFVELITPAAIRLGISLDRIHANRFAWDEEGRVQGVDPETPLARGGKPLAVRELGLDPASTWMIGDGATDAELRALGLVARFIAFTENRLREPVVARADDVVSSMETLIELLEADDQ